MDKITNNFDNNKVNGRKKEAGKDMVGTAWYVKGLPQAYLRNVPY